MLGIQETSGGSRVDAGHAQRPARAQAPGHGWHRVTAPSSTPRSSSTGRACRPSPPRGKDELVAAAQVPQRQHDGLEREARRALHRLRRHALRAAAALRGRLPRRLRGLRVQPAALARHARPAPRAAHRAAQGGQGRVARKGRPGRRSSRSRARSRPARWARSGRSCRRTRSTCSTARAELEEDVKREESWWYGTDDATRTSSARCSADITQAGLDARMTPAEEARIRASQGQVAAALADYIRVRDQFTDYASQAISFAAGLLIAAATGGAAGPAVIAAIMRAAAASAMARVAAEKALRGDRFDLVGGDGVRAFINGAVDGAMNVAGGAAAARAIGQDRRPGDARGARAGHGDARREDGRRDDRGGSAAAASAAPWTRSPTRTRGAAASRRGSRTSSTRASPAPGRAPPCRRACTAAQRTAPGRSSAARAPRAAARGGRRRRTPRGTGTAAGAPQGRGPAASSTPIRSCRMAAGGDTWPAPSCCTSSAAGSTPSRRCRTARGPRPGCRRPARPALTKALVAHRERLLASSTSVRRPARRKRERRVGADVDLNVHGGGGGEKLLDARG